MSCSIVAIGRQHRSSLDLLLGSVWESSSTKQGAQPARKDGISRGLNSVDAANRIGLRCSLLTTDVNFQTKSVGDVRRTDYRGSIERGSLGVAQRADGSFTRTKPGSISASISIVISMTSEPR